jgi:hypothetical protein
MKSSILRSATTPSRARSPKGQTISPVLVIADADAFALRSWALCDARYGVVSRQSDSPGSQFRQPRRGAAKPTPVRSPLGRDGGNPMTRMGTPPRSVGRRRRGSAWQSRRAQSPTHPGGAARWSPSELGNCESNREVPFRVGSGRLQSARSGPSMPSHLR